MLYPLIEDEIGDGREKLKILVETGRWADRYVESPAISMEMTENSTVADVINALGVPHDEAGVVIIGGRVVPWNQCLSDGDVLKVYPAIIGG